MLVPTSALIAGAGALLLGALVFGLATLMGLTLTAITIWDKIRPRTDTLATSEHVAAVEHNSDRRYNENRSAIIENRTNNEHRFGEISGQLASLQGSMVALVEQLAEMRGALGLNKATAVITKRKA